MVEFCVGDPMRTIFQLFALGVGVGGNANVGVHVGGYANFSVLETNILVSPTQNSRVWGLDQRQAPTREFCITVEYVYTSLLGISFRSTHA